MKYLLLTNEEELSKTSLPVLQAGDLSFEVNQSCSTFEDLIKTIYRTEFDGIIISHHLSCCFGSSLAMEIRTRQLENKLRIFPIVYFATDFSVVEYVEDLIDSIIDLFLYKAKDCEMLDLSIPTIHNKLIALVNGYKKMESVTDISNLLSLDDLSIIDNRFTGELGYRIRKCPLYWPEKFILKELIIRQGILIDEDILSIRLGIDKKSEGWNVVLDSLEQYGAKYRGVFSEGWNRWWMPLVEKWWDDIICSDKYIQFVSAFKRFEMILNKLNINKLSPVRTNSVFSVDNDYWTVCSVSKEPLAISDGLLLPGQYNLYPWQDSKYVSIEMAILNNIEVSVYDTEKLEYYKKLYYKIKNS